ncbi:MAG: hypothetical protein HYU68_05685 [Bacteroidetes bacterium]|nr:hypothetical protein [Bacteroidota bacterium]
MILIFTSSIFAQKTVELDKNLCKHWILTMRKTGNEDYHNSSSGAYKELILKCDGNYERKSTSYNTSGSWYISNNALGFHQTIENGLSSVSNGYNFAWIIVEVDQSKLVLKIEGKHGFEYYYYEPKN